MITDRDSAAKTHIFIHVVLRFERNWYSVATTITKTNQIGLKS